MHCPHLKETPYLASLKAQKLLSCKAGNKSYVPSLFEIEVYCKHRRHTLCPFYPPPADGEAAQSGRSDA
jgi:hypothetical protein